MAKDYAQSYSDHFRQLQARTPAEAHTHLAEAIGGEFVAVGKLEYYLLRSLGLHDGQCIVDVGCGTGRLAAQLRQLPSLCYIGCDVVDTMLAHARELAHRPDWQFVRTNGAAIPCAESTADFVCFFSVFTHLLHEDSYRYLREACRALRPGGLVVFSFLEFRIPCHWNTFITWVEHHQPGGPHNQFLDRDAIQQWASHLDLAVAGIWDGDKPHIPIPEVITWEGGQRMEGLGNLGQSVAVLRKS